jgi:hypothetical protein
MFRQVRLFARAQPRPFRWMVPIAFVLCYAMSFVGVVDAATTTCTQNAATVTSDNNWQWGSPGSWGLPGQEQLYVIKVTNNDAGCAGSSFVVGLSAPSGFSVSMPTRTISLKATTAGYLNAYVTAPNAIADGDYALALTVQRAGSSAADGSFTTYFKVYSSDTTPPTLYWPNPGDGTTISGRSYNVVVSSRDDHAVKKIDLYIDNAYVSSTACDDVTYSCTLSYKWTLRGTKGVHTATFNSYDWLGNTGSLTVSFTVS